MKPTLASSTSPKTSTPLLRSSRSNKSTRPKPVHTPISETSAKHHLLSPRHTIIPSEQKFFIQESPIDSLAQIVSPKQLPTKLSSLSSFDPSQELSNLGNPATRQDVNDLKNWLNIMLQKAVDSSSGPENLYETANSIYKICFHEVIRQVKVQCKERGELIKIVWDTYQGLFQQAIKVTQAQAELSEKQHLIEKNAIEKNAEKKINELLKIIGEMKKENSRLERELKGKEEAFVLKMNREIKMMQVLEIYKQQYAKNKEDLLLVKEDFRILQIRYENLQNLNSKPGSKVRRKGEEFMQRVMRSDPLLQYAGYNDDRNMKQDVERHSKYLEDLFTRADYIDRETNTNTVLVSNASTFTAVEDLCGESIGIKTRKKRRSKISDTNHITITGSLPSQIIEIPVTLNVNTEDHLITSEQKKKHIFVKKMLQNMSQTITNEAVKENLPHNNILNAVSSGLAKAITVLSASPLENNENSGAEEAEEKVKKLLLNIVPLEDEKISHSQYEIMASAMIKKIGMTVSSKLKHAMFKKNLLRLITSFYEEKTKDPSSKLEFGVYVYSLLMKKYMMKKAAENRFKHLLSSCVKFKNITRVRVFGRFLGLYAAFDSEDLAFYLSIIEKMKSGLSGKTFANLDSSEKHFTIYARCLETIKSVSNFFPVAETNDLYHKLDLIKVLDKSSKVTLVDIDEFMEILIEKHHSRQSENYSFLKYIYESADLNEDGYLQIREFNLLLRHLSSTSTTEGARLFEAFAETFLSDSDTEVKALLLESFIELNTKYLLFTPEKVFGFTKVKTDQDALSKLHSVHDELEFKLSEIQWRLSESQELGKYQEEFSNLLEVLRVKIYSIQNCNNPKSVWLCLRLLEEESKALLINDRLSELLPRFALAEL